MKHLGAEVGQVRRLVKTHASNTPGIGAQCGIGGHDSVDVGPDLNPAGVQPGADNRGTEIGAATTQSRWDAILRRANKSAKNGI